MEKRSVKEIKSFILKELFVQTSSRIMVGVLDNNIKFSPSKNNSFSQADLMYLAKEFPGSQTDGKSILIPKQYIQL